MPQRSYLLRAAVAAAVLALHASGAAAQGRISGVVNDETGKPIKAATVTAQSTDINIQMTATTDDKGRFAMIGLRSGTWRFSAQAPGYFADEGTAAVRGSGQPNPPISFSLKRTSQLAGTLGGISAKDLQAELASADALFNQRKWDEAIGAYRGIMEKTPSLSVINLQIATAFFNKKDYDSAISAYGELLKVDAGSEKAAVGIARMQMAKGDVAAAEGALLKAADMPGSGRDTFFALGDLNFDRDQIDSAMTWYQKAADRDPSSGRAWYKLGLSASKKGDQAAASTFMNKVLAVDPVSAEAALARAALDQLNR